jgi:hypothetical protein
LRHDHHLILDNHVILAGRHFERFITEGVGAHLVRPERKDEQPRFGEFGGIRQWIESIFETLSGHLGLEHHGARTLEELHARVASELLALVVGIWPNWKTNAPLTAYDH